MNQNATPSASLGNPLHSYGRSSSAHSNARHPAAQLAHVVHLSEGTLLLVRESSATNGWRERFRARLRTCGPWSEAQVQDYFVTTYGSDLRRWPISMLRIAQVFSAEQPEQSIAVARDTPEVRAFLS